MNPASTETANNLITVLVEAENLAEARDVAEAQMRRTPRNAELHCNLGRIFLLENDLDKAEVAFRKAISLNGRNAGSYVGLAQVLIEKNHHELALVCNATVLVKLRDIEAPKEDDGFEGAFLSS